MPDIHPLIAWAGPESVELLRVSTRDLRATLGDQSFTVGQHAISRASGDPMVAFLFMTMDHFAFDAQDLPADAGPFVAQWEASRSPQSLLVLADWLEDRGDQLAVRLRCVVAAKPRLFSKCPHCRNGEIPDYPNLDRPCGDCDATGWRYVVAAPLLHADLWMAG
jgi:hypothetical protein